MAGYNGAVRRVSGRTPPADGEVEPRGRVGYVHTGRCREGGGHGRCHKASQGPVQGGSRSPVDAEDVPAPAGTGLGRLLGAAVRPDRLRPPGTGGLNVVAYLLRCRANPTEPSASSSAVPATPTAHHTMGVVAEGVVARDTWSGAAMVRTGAGCSGSCAAGRSIQRTSSPVS